MAAKPIKFLELHYTMIQFLIINISFCALGGLLFTKINHYFNVYIDTNVSFCLFKVKVQK